MELSELLESIGESESESEAAEARPARGRGGRVGQPSASPSFRPRPPRNRPTYARKPQPEAPLTRSNARIKPVADGGRTITTRLTSWSAQAKKEPNDAKKPVEPRARI